jgi:asparagine synthase (glutamine-hydrolysing)
MGRSEETDSGVVFRRFDDDAVAVNIATNEVFQLSQTAAAIFELAREGRSEPEIASTLLETFDDAPANLVDEVRAVVAHMVRAGLLASPRFAGSSTAEGVQTLPSRWRARFSIDRTGLEFVAGTGCDADVFEDERCQVAVVGRMTNEDEQRGSARSKAAAVANAFRRHGDEFMRHLRGPSAILLFDRERRKAYVVRDRIGREPVFFARGEDNHLVASDAIATLLLEPGVSKEVDPVVLAAFAMDLGPEPDETCFQDIRRLSSGHALRWTRGEPAALPYWKLSIGDLAVRASTDDLYEEFAAKFATAVARETTGSAGLYLSGGLDSISVALAAHGSERTRLRVALGLSFPDPEFSEAPAQRAVADALGVELVLRSFDECLGGRSLVDSALALTADLDAPLQNIFRPAFAALDDEAKLRGVTHILGGFGGDEWLGVTPYWMADLLARGDLRGALRFAGEYQRTYALRSSRDIAAMAWAFGVRPFLVKGLQRLAAGTMGDAAFPGRARARRVLPDWLAPDPRVREALVERVARRSIRTGSDYERDVLRTLDHPIVMLEHEESAAIARRTGLARGAPFWDEDLVEFLARVPPSQLSSDRGKAFARRFVQERLADSAIVNQRKYVDPNHFLGSLGREVARPLRGVRFGQRLHQLGAVDADRMRGLCEGGNRSFDHATRLWSVVNTETWLRAHA